MELGQWGGCFADSYSAELDGSQGQVSAHLLTSGATGGVIDSLLVSDGTTEGTNLVTLGLQTFGSPILNFGDAWFALATDTNSAAGFWKLEPGDATELIREFTFNRFFGPLPWGLTTQKDRLFFAADSGAGHRTLDLRWHNRRNEVGRRCGARGD